jgi:dTMP kinase
MDLGLSRNVFDSFLKYQAAMGEAFHQLQKSYQFDIINANPAVDSVNRELRRKISAVLGGK